MTTVTDIPAETGFGMLFGAVEDGTEGLSGRLMPRVVAHTEDCLKALAVPMREVLLRQLILAAKEFFGVPLGAALGKGWCSYEQVRDAIRDTADDPNTTREVTLDEHQIVAEYSAVLAVELDGLPAALHELPLTLSMTVTLQSAAVEVRHGRLTQVQLGSGEVEVVALAYEAPIAKARRALQPTWIQELGLGRTPINVDTRPGLPA